MHPHPIDIHVGLRVQSAREDAGMSREALAGGLGITQQQLRKNEVGTNRIGCSRLYQIAETLGKPITFFFEGIKR